MRQIKSIRTSDFRIESNRTLMSAHWAVLGGEMVTPTNEIMVHDRSLAVAMAAKTRTVPCGGEIRVVHTPTGEVIFRKLNECGCAIWF
jgi:N-methylhydantoinase B/oxoprolinase/acetone carboxylase alpha subunit